MEVVKVLALHATQQLAALEMLTRAQSHSQNIVFAHAIYEILADIGAICLLLLSFRLDVFINKDTQLSSQLPVALVIVWALDIRRQP